MKFLIVILLAVLMIFIPPAAVKLQAGSKTVQPVTKI